jgi:Carboxypeptidase regulatory-like domain/TonB-dependent Receptor Plug Domain
VALVLVLASGASFATQAPPGAPQAESAAAQSPGAPVQGPPVSGQPALLALLKFQAAEYPPDLLLRGVEADLPCDLLLADDGRVLSATCAGADPALVVRAQDALLDARFSAAGTGTPVRPVTFIYRFAESVARLPEPPELPVHGELSGEVLVAGERRSLAGADVIAQGVGIYAVTDARGRFTLRVPPGSHVIVVGAPGFFPAQVRIEVADGARAEQTIFLRRRAVGELSATVEAEKMRLAPTRTTVVREELRNVPGSQGDPLRVLENLPGVARIPYTGGRLIVRGAREQETGAYLDGQRIPVLYHLLQGPSVLGEELVDKIDFYPGGAGVYFGRNLGGVVAVTSRRGDEERLHGSAAVDLQKSALFLQGPLGGATQFALGLRHSYVNPAVSFFADSYREVTVPIYWDYQARLDQRLDERDRLTLTAFGSQDSFAVLGGGRGNVPLDLGQGVTFHRLRLAFERQVSRGLSFSVAPLFGADKTSSRTSGGIGGALSLPQSSRDSTVSTGLRGDVRYEASDALGLRGGVDVLFDRVSYDEDRLFDQQLRGVGAPDAERRRLQGVKVFGSFGEYLEVEWRLGRLRLVPGLRIEELHYGRHTFVQLDPRFWARYALDAATSLNAYAGLHHQAPSAEQVDPQVGNPDLIPMRAIQLGAGGERRFGEALIVRLEGYLAIRKALVFPAAPTVNADGTFQNPLELNSGEGRSFGLELFVRRELTSTLYGWIAYSLSRSRELRGDGTGWMPTQYDQPHVLTLLVGFRPSPYAEFAVRMRVATGNPVAPTTGSSVFDADSGRYVPRLAPFGAARLPTFWQLDFEINNVWVSDLFRLQLYLDFENSLNRLNSETILYDYRYSTQAYIHGLPSTAIAGAKVSF